MATIVAIFGVKHENNNAKVIDLSRIERNSGVYGLNANRYFLE